MTKREMNALKRGDKVVHIYFPNEINVVESEKTKHGYFIREEGSRLGWNTINERNCYLYNKTI